MLRTRKKYVFVFLVLLLALPAFGDADAAIAAIEKARTEANLAASKLTQASNESPAEFAARKAKFVAEKLQPAKETLEATVFFLPADQVSVSPGAFDNEKKQWTLTIKSKNPAVPYSGHVVLSIAAAADTKAAFVPVDAAIKANSLTTLLSYRIAQRTEGEYWVRNLSVVVLPALAIIALPTPGWDFVGSSSNNPRAHQLVDLVPVAGGTFTMGGLGALPLHKVTLTSFRIGRTEITQAQYQLVMGKNPSNFAEGPEAADRPVEQLEWYDALRFCNKLSEMEGLQTVYTIDADKTKANFSANGYRLPTEAEWEYAARGGNKTSGSTYSGGIPVANVAWYESNSNSTTHPVATKKPNELGLYDMSGNVFEWCWDWQADYPQAAKTDPRGLATGTKKIQRGGAWTSPQTGLGVAVRDSANPLYPEINLGFRVVRQ